VQYDAEVQAEQGEIQARHEVKAVEESLSES
jgi:hypothetical protein